MYYQLALLYKIDKPQYFYLTDELSVTPLVFGITDSVINLPLAPGSTYRIIAIATDHVGNMQGVDDMDNVFVIDFPLLTSFCPNNCSGSGNCTTLGTCVCESGSFGNDCSDGTYTFRSVLHNVIYIEDWTEYIQ